MGIEDKVSGRVKQAAGGLTGSEALRRDGLEDERRGEAREEAARQQEAADQQQQRADEKAREAERLEQGGGSEPIADYDRLNADEVIDRLDGLSERELTDVETHERRNQDRKTVLEAVESKRV